MKLNSIMRKMKLMSRINKLKKNIMFGYIFSIVTFVLGFASRTVFLSVLNESYLGVNGLFTNLLGMLSFANLGIGTALNFSLYKPVKEKNIELIRALVYFQRKAYRVIAVVILVLGLIIYPFLDLIINTTDDLGNIQLYYLIFLFNSVSTYFVSYKYSVVNAEQKGYLLTKVNIVFSTITTIVNVIVLIVFKDFLFYLISSAAITLIQNVYFSIYLRRKYSYIYDKKWKPRKLTNEELEPIKKNIPALMVHKVGEVIQLQTDNIVISSAVNIAAVGLLSNYNLLMNSVLSFVSIIFRSAVPSFGNLIAEGDVNRNYETFKVFYFINFWAYGFTGIALAILSTPFIELWLGEDMIIGYFSVFILYLNYFIKGQKSAYLNFKTAHGSYRDDKFIVIVASGINLIISIILVNKIGLAGVLLGTLISNIYLSIHRPLISFRNLIGLESKVYFKISLKYLIVFLFTWVLVYCTVNMINIDSLYLSFFAKVIVTVIFPNLIFCFMFKNSSEFKEMANILMNTLKLKER